MFSWSNRLLALSAAAFAVSVPVALGTSSSRAHSPARATAVPPSPPHRLTARRMRPRPGAVPRGTAVEQTDLVTTRVFADASVGFALANVESAQYPARSLDGGRTWRIDGPQVHINAADAPEAVGFVGVADARTFFAYGSSAVDVTTNGGRTWWETFLGELVVAVGPGPRHGLVAYVQDQLDPNNIRTAATWQYVSHDGGRHWTYSQTLGGL
jgi:hypothetical protein